MNEDTPSESPPNYSASSNPGVPILGNFILQLESLGLGSLTGATTSAAMTAQNRGKLSLRAYTATQSVDAIQLLYVGLTTNQLTIRELDTTPRSLHSSHGKLECMGTI
jgi:hypothetical protein